MNQDEVRGLLSMEIQYLVRFRNIHLDKENIRDNRLDGTI